MLFELVRRARRRFLWNELLAQLAWALTAAFAAIILLLLLGTQILDWYWLMIVPAAALALGLYRVLRRLPSPYRLAQLLDQRLKLQDALSTAWIYSFGVRPSAEWVRGAQRRQADELAATVRLEHAVPFRMPRAIYSMAVLGFVATSLFALRYGLDRRLDLRPPLARVLLHNLGFWPLPQDAANHQPPQARKPKPRDRNDAMTLADAKPKGPGELDAAPDAALQPSSEPNLDNSKAQTAKRGPQAEQAAQQAQDQKQGDSSDESQSSSPGQNQGDQGAGKGLPHSQNAMAQQGGSSGENSSLMNKFRDAMQNLLSRMRQPGGQPSGMRQGSAGKETRQASGQTGQNSQHGGKAQQNGQSAQGQDGDNSQQARNAQNAQGKGTGQSADQQTRQPGSGIGREDGNKDVKLAEQLAAMGKISEIIGKRAANVTGEVTVEVQSTAQQLRTAYTHQNSNHLDTGGEISRDEVPMALQQYVQQYFEQIRRQAPDAAVPPRKRGEAAREATK